MSKMSGRPPVLSNVSICKLVKELYHFKHIDEISVQQFPSYYDANFYFRGTLHGDLDCSDGLGPTDKAEEYVLKILNSSRTLDMAAGISALWSHLQKKGLDYTSQLLNKQGKPLSTLTTHELLKFETNASQAGIQTSEVFSVRIMKFVPGVIFDRVDKKYLTPKLMYEVGAFIGRVDTALQDGFHNAAIEEHDNFDWDLVHFSKIRKHLPLLDDCYKREMVETVLKGFEEYVPPRLSSFRKGIIYNDVSGQNTIMRRCDSEDKYRVVGMIDFDETVHSCYVFDLAVAIAYISMENLNPICCSDPIEFVAPMICGYVQNFALSPEEISCLYYLTLARCCQSAVSGEVSFKAEPWNEYLLTTPQKSWKVIELLLKTGKENVDKVWGDATRYLSDFLT